MGLEKIIIKHQNAIAEFLKIGINEKDIVAKINAYDWFDLQNAESEGDLDEVVKNVFDKFNFKTKKQYVEIVYKAFQLKFLKSIALIKEAIEYTNSCYNIPNASINFENEIVNKYYYLNYWADKKNIPLNINEKDITKRDLFNLDTIILSILADKLSNYNDYERNKPKAKG